MQIQRKDRPGRQGTSGDERSSAEKDLSVSARQLRAWMEKVVVKCRAYIHGRIDKSNIGECKER